jgi:hypothetical protein
MHGSFGTMEDRIFSVQASKGNHPHRQNAWRSASVDDGVESIASPIFLVGSVRSGTTLLRLMLDHHPELAFFHEFPFAVVALPDSGWPDLDSYYEFLLKDRIYQDSRLEIDSRLDYPQLMNSFLKQKRDRDHKRVVGATVHIHFDRLLRIWPDARFIHIVRDGRDVGRSRVELGWAGNMYTGVQTWIEAERLWEQVQGVVPASRRVELKYENLVMNAEQELTRICDFLDLAFDPAMLRYNEHSTYDKPDPKLIGQWRRKLPAQAVRIAEARIAEMLVDRGYELSEYKPLKIGPLRERMLLSDDRKNRLAARHQLYGSSLFLSELMIRALDPAYRKFTNFRKEVRERIHEIERSILK